jgi:hypothetical protein
VPPAAAHRLRASPRCHHLASKLTLSPPTLSTLHTHRVPSQGEGMSTTCIAVSSNDVILVAWMFAHKLDDCVGCDVRRIPAESANIHSDEPQGESLPATAGFPGDPNAGRSGRTTAQAPVLKLFWKVRAKYGTRSRCSLRLELFPRPADRPATPPYQAGFSKLAERLGKDGMRE